MNNVLNIAHRGASAYAHENTIEAIEKAIELGADMVEFDLRCTADGAIVLWHDEKVNRGKGKPIPVSNMTLDELHAHAGERGFGVARFDEVLMQFGHRIAFDIEIKATGFEEEIIALLRRYPPVFPPVIASFYPEVIDRTKKLDGKIMTALVVSRSSLIKSGFRSLSAIKRLAVKTGANSVHLNLKIASASIIKELTDLGFGLYIWTVNDEIDMKKLIRAGVNGIVTDKPDLLNSVRENMILTGQIL